LHEYSPKRRTALVFTGSGASGAYHAGVLKALEESGIKIDLVVGSGVGTIAAAYAAVDGGSKLYGPGGFWEGVRWSSFFRLRPAALVVLALLATSFVVFLLPVALALLAGLLFPLVLIADRLAPGAPSRLLGQVWVAPESLSGPYLAALAMPIFVLALLAMTAAVVLMLRDRRRLAESVESLLDSGPGQERLRRGLWQIARGAALSTGPPSEGELGKRYVALLAENLGQPGFREMILRVADLDAGGALSLALLGEEHLRAFAGARARGAHPRDEAIPSTVDLRAAGYADLLFDAVLTGILPPVALPVRRIAFPKRGLYAGETHRLTDATLVGGSGVAEALDAGAEQVIVVSGAPETPALAPRRRGPWARLDATVSVLERRAVERDLDEAERINRMVATLGHRTDDGGRAWQDPATGRLYRELALYAIRPERRMLGPLELGGARDPATEVLETTADLLEQGYRDAHRRFVEPVVGAAPLPVREDAREREMGQPIEL
jgi:patatin-like phospholipase